MQGGNSRGGRVPDNHQRNGEAEDQVDLDEIQFQNKLEYDEEDEDNSPNN